jgi:dienelactone hydrolase
MTQRPSNRRTFLRSSAWAGLLAAGGKAGLAHAAPTGTTAAATEAAKGMRLFSQPDLNFEALFALGTTAYGAGEAGEIFATVDSINKAGASYQTFFDGFMARAAKTGQIAADAGKAGHRVSARGAHLRAAQYYNQALFFVLGTSTPNQEADVYKRMQQHWNSATALFNPVFEPVRIPYQGTHLPGYFLHAGDDGAPRPTVIVMNGSDAQFVDVYAFGGAAATERGWNALIFEGPGQGSMLFEHKMPFRPDWEKVITPVVDFLVQRPDVDARRVALTGWSFGGLLATRAAAFEKRLAAVVADPGSVDSWLAYPETLRRLVSPKTGKKKADQIWQKEIVPHLPRQARFTLSKRSEIYGRQFLEAARAGKMFDSLWDLAQIITQYRVDDVAAKITTPVLVTQYEGEQFTPDGGQKLYNLLTGSKELATFTAAEGAGLHDGPLAPQRRNQVVYDWLADVFAKVGA